MTKHGELITPTTLKFERMLPGPIDRVWEYLTDEKKRGLWFAGGPTDLAPGGVVTLIFKNSQLSDPVELPPEKYKNYGDGFQMDAKVVKCEAPKLFVMEWEGIVTFELEQMDDKVKLVLTHEKLSTDMETRKGTLAGWHGHLDILDEQLNGRTHKGGFWTEHLRLQDEYYDRIS